MKNLKKYFKFTKLQIINQEEYTPAKNKHKFLYDSLYGSIKYLKNIKNQKECINFFDKIYFEIEECDIKPQKSDFFACYASSKEIKDDVAISQELRNTNTLKIDNSNCYDNTDIKVIFSEKGFMFISKFDESSHLERFHKVALLYLLAQAYNFYTLQLTSDISTAYSSNNFQKMLDIRKEVYLFDLSCFYTNPVKYQTQQMYTIWKFIENNYNIGQNHYEMKSQMQDLVNVIEIELKDQEQKEKNIESKKQHKTTIILGIMGLIFTALSVISAYSDLVELGLLSNIFKSNSVEKVVTR